jgi:myo-inositol 2-dehydrogenase/D-chiro-inositol 1-dehydrogenase
MTGVALVGLGRMGRLHAQILSQGVHGLRVVAAAEPDAQAANRARGLFTHDVQIYADVDQALGHPGVDACVVVTPTASHADLCAAALDAGLHVFCEKPLTLEPGRDMELASISNEAGRLLQVGYWRRFAQPWTVARDVVAAGRIGKLVSIRSVQWDGEPPPPTFCDPAVSGGLLVDCGVHDYDLVEWLSGERVVTVETRDLRLVDAAIGRVGDIDNAWVFLDLTHGVRAHVDLSRNGRAFDDVRTEILASNGSLLVSTQPRGHVVLRTPDGERTIYESSSADEVFVGGLRSELEHFAAAIGGSIPWDSVPGATVSAHVLRVAHAAYRSLEMQAPASVADPSDPPAVQHPASAAS